jgi:hypothetical protein
MDILKGLTKEQAIKAGILVPIDMSDPNWAKKLAEQTPSKPIIIKKDN